MDGSTFLFILLLIAMLATLVVLGVGVWTSLGPGSSPDQQNKLMRWRVLFQGASLVLFALLLWVRHG